MKAARFKFLETIEITIGADQPGKSDFKMVTSMGAVKNYKQRVKFVVQEDAARVTCHHDLL